VDLTVSAPAGEVLLGSSSGPACDVSDMSDVSEVSLVNGCRVSLDSREAGLSCDSVTKDLCHQFENLSLSGDVEIPCAVASEQESSSIVDCIFQSDAPSPGAHAIC
jgi:hypothetical protein